jgi:hypothetical protein
MRRRVTPEDLKLTGELM